MLCDRYPRFYRFGKVLERLAEGIASGRLAVPKYSPTFLCEKKLQQNEAFGCRIMASPNGTRDEKSEKVNFLRKRC